MDHLNVFNAYKSKSNVHENELTRIFLILIKNIPMLQMMFFDMIKNEMREDDFSSIITDELFMESVYTQLSNNNEIFTTGILDGRSLISVIISDDKLESSEPIMNSDRKARYDGVILCKPGWVFIIENKPSKNNIWLGQLNPNTNKREISIIQKPCCLSWRKIITRINLLISNDMIHGVEKTLTEDFIEYVDEKYSVINPYTNFSVCKDDKYLLDKRCILAMNSLKINGIPDNVLYHKGWKHYIPSGKSTIKEIALDSTFNGTDWSIDLWMVVGDSMNSARESFKKLDINKLDKLKTNGFIISKNFHVSYRSSNLLWFTGGLNTEEYITYWKQNIGNLRQAKRIEFESMFLDFEKLKLILDTDQTIFKEKILSKNYDKLNICPGFLIKYTWSSQIAINLDFSNSFDVDFKDKVNQVFEIFGETI